MEQQKKKKRAVAFGLVAVVLIFWNLMQNTADQQKLKVACIGDELTFEIGRASCRERVFRRV